MAETVLAKISRVLHPLWLRGNGEIPQNLLIPLILRKYKHGFNFPSFPRCRDLLQQAKALLHQLLLG